MERGVVVFCCSLAVFVVCGVPEPTSALKLKIAAGNCVVRGIGERVMREGL
jgi:hypothetical protein